MQEIIMAAGAYGLSVFDIHLKFIAGLPAKVHSPFYID